MQATDKSRREEKHAIVMNAWITQISRDGIPAIQRVNALEVLRDLVKSFVPSDALPTLWGAANGVSEPVFIVVNVLQGNGLWTDVPSAERIVFVTTYVQTLVGLNSDFDTTNRFAEIAGCDNERGAIVGSSHMLSTGKFISENLTDLSINCGS